MDADAGKRVRQFLDRSLNMGRALGLPPALNRCLEDFASFRLGEGWWSNAAQARTLDADLAYLDQRWLDGSNPPAYTEARYVAYALGFLPLGFLKVARLLNRLAHRHAFPGTLEILDNGCGPGTASVSALHFFDLLSQATRLLGSFRGRAKPAVHRTGRESRGRLHLRESAPCGRPQLRAPSGRGGRGGDGEFRRDDGSFVDRVGRSELRSHPRAERAR